MSGPVLSVGILMNCHEADLRVVQHWQGAVPLLVRVGLVAADLLLLLLHQPVGVGSAESGPGREGENRKLKLFQERIHFH